jgi:hypothetical protein
MPRGFMSPVATVGHAVPDALALGLAVALALALAEFEADGLGTVLDRVDALGRGAIDVEVPVDGLELDDGAQAAATSARAAALTSAVRAPTTKFGGLKDMNKTPTRFP